MKRGSSPLVMEGRIIALYFEWFSAPNPRIEKAGKGQWCPCKNYSGRQEGETGFRSFSGSVVLHCTLEKKEFLVRKHRVLSFQGRFLRKKENRKLYFCDKFALFKGGKDSTEEGPWGGKIREWRPVSTWDAKGAAVEPSTGERARFQVLRGGIPTYINKRPGLHLT